MKKIVRYVKSGHMPLLNALRLIDHLEENGAKHELQIDDALFGHLSSLINETADGVKIDYHCSKDSNNGFKVFETNSANGDNLGRLHMLYLSNPVPCYYLVYVEVRPSFRNKKLGLLMVKTFSKFLEEKGAVGILDNIIPANDSACQIYGRNGWKPLKKSAADCANYMVYRSRAQAKVKEAALNQLVYNLKKKETVREMKSNELGVKQTLQEFSDLYQSLSAYYADEVCGKNDEVMRFMFTRFVTKLVAYRRSIDKLLGYTGGESVEQITNAISSRISSLKVKSYQPAKLIRSTPVISGDETVVRQLPKELADNPTEYIENLPCYRRPDLVAWIEETGKNPDAELTIGDLLNLGFDPTRLKVIIWQGKEYIFERMPKRLKGELKDKQEALESAKLALANVRIKNARVNISPLLLEIQAGNDVYLLWDKVRGVHADEVLKKLDSDPYFKTMDSVLHISRLIRNIKKEAVDQIAATAGKNPEEIGRLLTFFFPWDFKRNTLDIMVDIDRPSFCEIWLL